ncbi:hypothetical protein KHC33_01300 [Methanospirillum sp. J.3.6.1-F.2.7.3]|uniref:Phosphoribosyltransferase domain-containing protein n=1 Tax=Methanospirillum purgamenti TaxID=2834276 RepID=A0A8E7AYN1_9EURY|nr:MULTISPECIES: phosphoribosyltransferase family protein [Methanospirillum]MDX8549517.1 phosphoribosyltransferase family protein [Methanospirillum hungatei]QVV89200.1 hypothetical protein KHC33_01300 [Methanospirillum sp. J.3.6.1-F.2.7.3]
MNFITYAQLNNDICNNLHKLPIDIDLIVGIPRSGLLVAAIIALYRNIPFTDIDSLLNEKMYNLGLTRKSEDWIHSIDEAKHILIVDDSISTCEAMKKAKEQINKSSLNCQKTFCVAYALPTNFRTVDICFKICNHPRMFEWNYMHHWGLKHACMDIDGVLCADPGFFQNDDSKKYENFLLNAAPKLIPTQPVGYLVTSRLEKYRGLTELWLNKNCIEYNNLIMLHVPDAATRLRTICHGEFKGEVYKKTDSFIFIESSYEQAVEICKIAKKPVFCTENNLLIKPDEISAHLLNLLNDWRITSKRMFRKIIGKRK